MKLVLLFAEARGLHFLAVLRQLAQAWTWNMVLEGSPEPQHVLYHPPSVPLPKLSFPHIQETGPEQLLLREGGFSGEWWGAVGEMEPETSVVGKNGSHLSRVIDPGNTELLNLQKWMQVVGSIPLKATAVVSWTPSQISYQPVFTFFLQQNLECLKRSWGYRTKQNRDTG